MLQGMLDLMSLGKDASHHPFTFGHHSENQSQGTIDLDIEGGLGSSEEGQSLVISVNGGEQDYALSE